MFLVDKELPVEGQDDAMKAKWFPLNELPNLAFDHKKILTDALKLITLK